MKFFVLFSVVLLAAVAMTQGKPAAEVETPNGVEEPKGVEAPKEDLKGAEAAYLAYSYAAYPYVAPFPYVVPPAAVLLRR